MVSTLGVEASRGGSAYHRFIAKGVSEAPRPLHQGRLLDFPGLQDFVIVVQKPDSDDLISLGGLLIACGRREFLATMEVKIVLALAKTSPTVSRHW